VIRFNRLVIDSLLLSSSPLSSSAFEYFDINDSAAVALIVVLGHVMSYRYAFFPVMVDSILLVMAGALYSNLTGKRYPDKSGLSS
jgi:hypothetical protein